MQITLFMNLYIQINFVTCISKLIYYVTHANQLINLYMQIHLFDSLIYTHLNEFITIIKNRYTPDLTNPGASSSNSSSSSSPVFKPHKLVLGYHTGMQVKINFNQLNQSKSNKFSHVLCPKKYYIIHLQYTTRYISISLVQL